MTTDIPFNKPFLAGPELRYVEESIRGVSRPYPGAFTQVDGRRLVIWSASQAPAGAGPFVGGVPGRVVSILQEGVVVLTGDGSILVREVEREKESAVAARDVLNKLSLTLGR